MRCGRRASWPVTLTALAVVAAGCGTVRTAVVEPTVPGIVNDGLESLTTTENKERMRELLTLVGVEETTREKVAQLVGSSLDELSEPERQEQLQGLVDALLGAAAASLAQAVSEELGPAVIEQSDQALASSLAILLSEDVRQESAALARFVTAAWGRELAASTRDEIGPALSELVERELLPSLARGIEGELAPPLSRSAREVTREAALGLADALSGELGGALDAQLARWLEQGKEATGGLRRTLYVIMAALGLGLLAVSLLLWRYLRLLRARTRALELVTATTKSYCENGPTDLVRLIKSSGRGSPAGRALSDFLAERPHLKVEPREA